MNKQRLKNLLLLLVAGYLIVSGVKLGTPWLRNQMFVEEMDNQARALVVDGTAERTTRRLLESARGYKIPIDERNLTVIRDLERGQVLVEAKYRVVVVLPFGLYTHTWNFNPRFVRVIPSKLRGRF
ncbi:MAG: hypothetical protein JSV26_02120 [bacterium]|nr:MAG: hypothetical protein JSV26_02120 [bacterium]